MATQQRAVRTRRDTLGVRGTGSVAGLPVPSSGGVSTINAPTVEVRPSPNFISLVGFDHRTLFVVGELLHRSFACDLAISVGREFCRVCPSGYLLETLQQDQLRLLEVLPLAPTVLDYDGCSRWTMDDSDSRIGLVAMLATLAATAVGEDIEILIC